MMEIKARDLIAAGWPEGWRLGAALKLARSLEASGASRVEALAEAERRFPKEVRLIGLRGGPAPLAAAVESETEVEAANVASAAAKMRELLHVPVVERGALMPDTCPAGSAPATIPVGGAIAVRNAIIPGAHSADICCSMFATFFTANHAVGELMDHLQKSTHFGPGGRRRGEQWHSPVLEQADWTNPFLTGLQSRAQDFMGTQGDGNHFAYLGLAKFDEDGVRALREAGHEGLANMASAARHGGYHVLVTHHGSRGFGADIYKRGQTFARKWCDQNGSGIPDAGAWIPYDTDEGRAYWDALQYVARWTKENHRMIHAEFVRRAGVSPVAQFGNEHNFVWKRGDIFYHGKGATPAWKDDQGLPLVGIIPLNMAREILLVLGRDNSEYLSFCPHGAGRNMSRSAMMKPFKDADGNVDPARVRDVVASVTDGLDVRWFSGTPDLSESPLGYKDATKVKDQINRFGLATVFGEISPLGCIMAGEAPEPFWLKAKREKREAHRAARREGATQAAQ